MSEGTPWAIEASGLVKYYGSIVALKGVDLCLKKGEFLTIFGPNGAGKTTLIKILGTLLRPTSGSIKIYGQDLRASPHILRRSIGLISHKTFLYGNLTAYENLAFYGRMYGVPRVKERIMEVVEQVGLSHRLHSQVVTFSRGMMQRLGLARAILHQPTLLLFDEPYTGLDPAAIKILADLLRKLHDGSRTAVMTTHNLVHGLEVCDQVAIQVEGRISFQKPKAELEPTSFEEIYFQQVKEAAVCI